MRGRFFWVAAAAITASFGLQSSASAQSAEPEFVVVQFDTVEVESFRSGTSDTWDGAREKSGGDCGVIGLLGAGAALAFGAPPSAGATAGKLICGLSNNGSGQQERDTKAPDLVIRLSTGSGIYYTPVVWDAYSHDFAYKIVVPLAAIPVHGLKLAVLDKDGSKEAQGELIGSFRLRPEQLLDGKLHTLKASGVKSLEMSATVWVPPKTSTQVEAKAKKGLTGTSIKVLAGQMVRVKAAGQPSVRSYDGKTMGPAGYPARFKDYNIQREPFKSGPHASAVALVAADQATTWGVIASDCISFVAPFSGNLVVGINDKGTSNNHGSFRFTVETLGSNSALWAKPGARLACGADAATGGAAVSSRALPESLSKKQITEGMSRIKSGVAACAHTHKRKQLSIQMRIGPTGQVLAAVPAGERGDLRVCVEKAVKRASFAKTQKGISLTYPFVFR